MNLLKKILTFTNTAVIMTALGAAVGQGTIAGFDAYQTRVARAETTQENRNYKPKANTLTPPSHEHKTPSQIDFFKKAHNYERPPTYLDDLDMDIMPNLKVTKPQDHETGLGQKLKKYLRKKGFNKIRSKLKSIERNGYRQSPEMRYDFHEERINDINNIGRNPRLPEDEKYSQLFKETTFQEDIERREQNPLFSIGAITLTDSGSIVYSPSKKSNLKDNIGILEVEEYENPEPYLIADRIKFNPKFKVSINPARVLKSGNPLDAFKKYNISLDIDFLSDVTGRELFSLEAEAELKDNKYATAYANFVIKFR
jgi:hypothetical protein